MINKDTIKKIHIVYGISISTLVYIGMYHKKYNIYPILIIEWENLPMHFPVALHEETVIFINHLFPWAIDHFCKVFTQNKDSNTEDNKEYYMTSSHLLLFLYEYIKKKWISIFSSDNLPKKFKNNPKVTFVQGTIPYDDIIHTSLNKRIHIYELPKSSYIWKDNILYEWKTSSWLEYKFCNIKDTVFLYIETPLNKNVIELSTINRVIWIHMRNQIKKSDINKYYNFDLKINYVIDNKDKMNIHRLGNALGYISPEWGRWLAIGIYDSYLWIEGRYDLILQYRKKLYHVQEKIYKTPSYYKIREKILFAFFHRLVPRITDIYKYYQDKEIVWLV